MSARTLRCPGCGAPVAPDDPQCPYCRAQLATVACPSCLGLAPVSAEHCPACGAALAPRQAADSGRPCPACPGALSVSRLGEVEVQGCAACGGLWLDREVFEQLGAARERQGAVLGALPPAEGPTSPILGEVRYRPCPACGQRMNRTNYARRSGVVLDVCRAHGLWFDKDELRRVLAFIADGGLERARARELEELKEARRAAVQSRQPAASLRELGSQAGDPGSWLSAAGLMALVAGALLDGD